MEHRISIPRTSEILAIESRACQRFRRRYFGWTGLCFTFVVPPFLITMTFLHFSQLPVRAGVTLLLLAWFLVQLHNYCHAGCFNLRGVFWCVEVLAADAGLLPGIAHAERSFRWPRWSEMLPGVLRQWPASTKVLSIAMMFDWDGMVVLFNDEPGALLEWRRFPILWQFPDCWMLITEDHRTFIPIAVPALDDACRTFIADQVRDSGGAIRVSPGIGLGLMYLEKVI